MLMLVTTAGDERLECNFPVRSRENEREEVTDNKKAVCK